MVLPYPNSRKLIILTSEIGTLDCQPCLSVLESCHPPLFSHHPNLSIQMVLLKYQISLYLLLESLSVSTD